MDKQMEEIKRGRPKTDDPKMKFDNVRLKSSTLLDIQIISEYLDVSQSTFVQTIIENEINKYKKLLKI